VSGPFATVESGATPRVAGQFAGSSSASIEQGTTNLVTNPIGGAGAVTGWVAGGTNTITAVTFAAEGIADPVIDGKTITTGFRVTYQDLAVPLARIPATLTAAIHAYGLQVYLPAAWDGTGSHYVGADNFAVGSGTVSAPIDTGLRDQWQRAGSTFTPGGADLTGNLTVRVGAPTVGRSLYITAGQIEQKSTATSYCDGSLGTGYSWSGTAHASSSVRAASRVRLGSAGLDETAGAVALWYETAGDEGDFVRAGVDWRDDANNRITAYPDNGSSQITVERLAAGVGAVLTITTGVAWTAADNLLLIVGWDAGNLYAYLYVNGTLAASGSAANTAIPTLSATTLDVGSIAGSSAHLNGQIAAAVLFAALPDAVARDYFAALTRPPYAGEHVGGDMVTVWDGSRKAYAVTTTNPVA